MVARRARRGQGAAPAIIYAAVIAGWMIAALSCPTEAHMGTPIDQAIEEHVPALVAPLEGRIQPSPYNFDFRGDDALRLTVHNSQSGCQVAVHWRLDDPKGRLVANRHILTPTADRTATTSEFDIGLGRLLNCTVFASAGSPRRGQTFTRLQVLRGRGDNAIVLGTVAQGYVTGNQDLAWPGSALEGSLEGDGYTRHIEGTDPAPGALISETVPTGARWQLVNIQCRLVTDGTGGTRTIEGDVNLAGNTAFNIPSPLTQAISSTIKHMWAEGMPFVSSPDSRYAINGLPIGNRLLAGDQFITQVSNMGANDNFNAPFYTVREWLEAQ